MKGASFFHYRRNSDGNGLAVVNLRTILVNLLAVILVLTAQISIARATVTEKDIKVIARMIGLVENGPKGKVQVVVASNGSSAQTDVDAFLTLIGSGKNIGDITLIAQSLPVELLASTTARVVLVPSGMNATQLDHIFTVASNMKLITISTSEDCLHAQKCAISVRSDPAVDIKLSASAAAATGVRLGSALRMMVKETP